MSDATTTAPEGQDDGPDDDAQDQPKLETRLLDHLATLGAEVWMNANNSSEAWITVPFRNAVHHWPMRGGDFEAFLHGIADSEFGAMLGRETASRIANCLGARARFADPPVAHEPAVRVGGHERRVYVDLGDDARRVIEIDADGWRECSNPPVRFYRPASLQPLAYPTPRGTGCWDALRSHMNVDDDQFTLVVGFIVGCFRPASMPGCEYPMLSIDGPQNSGKSTMTRRIKALVDPSAADLANLPRSEQDLFIRAQSDHLLSFENIDNVSPDMSDALCRITTGASMRTRTLYTTSDETILSACRPVIANGIPSLTGGRSDLVDRAIVISALPLESRVTDKEALSAEFEAERGRIMSAVFDAVSCALRCLPEVNINSGEFERGRMLSWQRWVEAAAGSLGWERGHFSRVYCQNRDHANRQQIDASPLASSVIRFMADQSRTGCHEWEGAPSDLFAALMECARRYNLETSRMPSHANKLRNAMRKVSQNLSMVGINFEELRRTSVTAGMRLRSKRGGRHLEIVAEAPPEG